MLLLVWAVYGLHSRLEWSKLVGQSDYEIENFGGNDWVTWEDRDEGVVAKRIHPLVKSNAQMKERYFKEGDILKRLEYQDVYKSEMINQFSYHTPPGTVVLYWVDRPGSVQPGGGWKSLFLENSVRPRFTFIDEIWLWSLQPWILVVGVFVSLISILIIFPIVRRAPRETWRIFLVVTFSFLVFMTMSLHHLNLLVSNSYNNTNFEQFFTLMMALLLPLYGIVTIFGRLNNKQQLLSILPLAIFGYAFYKISNTVYGLAFFQDARTVEIFVMVFFGILVLSMLLLSMIQNWKGRSKIDKVFHILALIYVSPLVVIYHLDISNYAETAISSELTDVLIYGAVFIPLINAAAAQLKFGRVSLVLTGTLQIVVASATILLLYFLLHFSLEYFGFHIKYQSYLELSLIILAVLVLRAIYKLNEPRIKRYFVLAQQNRRDKIDRFIASISQYPSSKKLLTDLVSALEEYFETDTVGIRIKGEPIVGKEIDLDQDKFEHLYQNLKSSGRFWTRNRQIAQDTQLAEADKMLLSLPFQLATPITINEKIYGILMVGKKRRGVFNLEDQELIQRINQQTRLTLGVLHLLEREKLLMQKNYEANLTALRSQINPHFLFNTLNTISALIHDDPDDAEIAVEKLAYIFRYTLKNSDKATVALKDELSLVKTYLEIEKIRFGERLQLKFEIPEHLLEVNLPAFVVQTVIENCIKHGIAKIIGKGIVSIKISDDGYLVRCEIEDNGPGIDLSRIHASTGLSNSHTRMAQIYGRDDLLLFENTGNGTKVTILLPK